jgi:hypothetical protein
VCTCMHVEVGDCTTPCDRKIELRDRKIELRTVAYCSRSYKGSLGLVLAVQSELPGDSPSETQSWAYMGQYSPV